MLAVLVTGPEMGEDPGDGPLLLRVPDRLDLQEVVAVARGDDPREYRTHDVVCMFLAILPAERYGFRGERRVEKGG